MTRVKVGASEYKIPCSYRFSPLKGLDAVAVPSLDASAHLNDNHSPVKAKIFPSTKIKKILDGL